MKRGIWNSKKAQFYIIAAVIIIFVLVGIVALTNLSKKKKSFTKIYDLGDELGIETGHVYDYGVYQKENLDNLVDHWSNIYLNYTKRQEAIEDWIFIYGDNDGMTALTFTTITKGTIGIYAGGTYTGIEIEEQVPTKRPVSIEPGATHVEVEVPPQNFTYGFDLKEGENFFFVIRGAGYVSKPEE